MQDYVKNKAEAGKKKKQEEILRYIKSQKGRKSSKKDDINYLELATLVGKFGSGVLELMKYVK